MRKLKVATILGTRPEIIRLSRIIARLDAVTDHVLVHTGQNYDYELNEIFFSDLLIRKPDEYLECATTNVMETIAKVIEKSDLLLRHIMPDAVLILGDTNSCLSALSAKKRKIPIFHMEAGNRCFDMRVPEEINRRIVDHISDVNLTYSSIARDYLLREGLPPDCVITVGSPMREVINFHSDKIDRSNILVELGLEQNSFFLVSAHREENIENSETFLELCTSLNKIAEIYKMPIIVSTHPRTKQKLDQTEFKFNNLVKFLPPLSFTSYNKLQISSFLVLSDSGTISEEASILQFDALNLRYCHERPEAMEECSVMMVGLHYERIIQAISIIKSRGAHHSRRMGFVKDYSSDCVSEKVVGIIHSYVDYVNKRVWFK